VLIELTTSSIINIIMLLILLYLIVNNHVMEGEIRNAYMIAIAFTVLVIAAEIATNIFDRLGSFYRVPNIVANTIGFSLSTCIPIVFALVLDKNLYKKVIYICMPILLNLVITISSAWTGLIFWVSKDNSYTRGPLFGIYIITYLYGLVLLMICNYRQSLKYQKAERKFLGLLYVIFIIGTTVQVVFPFIHSSWHCITLVLVMYYLFLRELQFKYDSVTRLLNRQAYERRLHHLRKTDLVGIIVFDVDNFKIVNDIYGHVRGDYYLQKLAFIICSSFKKIGQCYRIGGDEFCVLAPNINEDAINGCIQLMLRVINQEKENDLTMPSISFGYSIYRKSVEKDILQLVQEADEKMYCCKANK
jgi:diguanylate cyclase (GGDEF)-like protein